MRPVFMSPDRMIVFDYSGTLSLESPLFARPDFLMARLEACGLKAFGIGSPRVFWDVVVNPTWREGSTTAAGYKNVLYNGIAAALLPGMKDGRHAGLETAVAAFVDDYFGHSRIDSRWGPILRKVGGNRSTRAVIATDHYAEATDWIIRNLGAWGIAASAAAGSEAGGRSAP